MRDLPIKINLNTFNRRAGDGIFFLSYNPICKGAVIEYNGIPAVVKDYVVVSMYFNMNEKKLNFKPYSKHYSKSVSVFEIDDLGCLDSEIILRVCGVNSFTEFVACYKDSIIKERNIFRSYVFMYLISLN